MPAQSSGNATHPPYPNDSHIPQPPTTSATGGGRYAETENAVKRTLGHRLAAALPELSSTDALGAMKSIGIAELYLSGQTTRLVSLMGRDARRVLAALGTKDIEPPNPEKQQTEPQI
jgi:hypothetical protein